MSVVVMETIGECDGGQGLKVEDLTLQRQNAWRVLLYGGNDRFGG